MPTRSSRRIASALASRPCRFWFSSMASRICAPIFLSGFRLVMGSCVTMAIFLPRMVRHCASVVYLARSLPSYRMEPPVTEPFLSSMPTNVFVKTDLPEPLSPTIASVSPSYRSSEQRRMAFSFWPRRVNCTSRSFTERIGSVLSTCCARFLNS